MFVLVAMMVGWAVGFGVAFPRAWAQTPGDSGETLWLTDAPESPWTGDVLAGIEDGLAGERDGHLLGVDELASRVDEEAVSIWECAAGVESCGTTEEMIFDALDLGLLIRLNVINGGDDRIEINYEMVDRRGQVAGSGRVEAGDGRQAGLDLVGELFEAVGVVSFDSTPSNAVVEIDGRRLGTTPFSEQLEVGSHAYRAMLDGYDDVEGSFEVTTGEVQRVEVTLDERPAMLRVEGAPKEARLWIDDKKIGRASELAEVEPGRTVVEIRAEGYETYRQSIDLEPGQRHDVGVEMREMPALLRDVDAAEIADHRFQFEVGLEVGSLRSEMHRARGDIDGDTVIFDGWRADDGWIDTEERRRRFAASPGLRLSAGWEGDRVGLGVLSVSFHRHSLDEPVLLRRRSEELPAGDSVEGTMTSMQSIQLRPMQLRVREFYENLALYAQTGLGVAFQRMDVETDEGDGLSLGQTDALGAVELGIRYHFDARWSVGGSLRLQRHFGDGAGTQQTLGIGIGTGLRELPGLEPSPPGEL